MAAKVTEAQVRELLGAVETFMQAGRDETIALCKSWLEQHEALRWVPVSSGSLPPKLETVRLSNGKSSWLGCACHCGELPPHDLCSGLTFTHFQKIPPLPKEGE